MSAAHNPIKAVGALLLCLVLTVTLLALSGLCASAAERKLVRVGWFDSALNRVDASGRRSGYAYEYQQKIAAYTGWQFEYVEGTWPELLEMLENGEIDLLSEVSYTYLRTQKMLYADKPMGSEDYYLFITPDNQSVTADDLTTLNGKRVGVMRGSVQAGMLRQWVEENGLSPEIVQLTTLSDEDMELLYSGELDALVTMDGLGVSRPCVPVCKVGASDIYFAVNTDRPDLLAELNDAMDRILGENPYYHQQLSDKYIRAYGSSAFLSASEQAWNRAHSPIRVAYCADNLPFCAEQDGALNGALADVLSMASASIKNDDVRFSPVVYPTVQDALDALRAGAVDCVFPVHLSPYDEETGGLLATNPLLQAELYAVLPQAHQGGLSTAETVTVAVQTGNANYEVCLKDFFPNWKPAFYETAEDCVRAVNAGEADCVLVSSYRLSYAQQLFQRYDFETLPMSQTVNVSFAVRREDVELYSILNKSISLIPQASVEAALLAQSLPEKKVTLLDYARDNQVRAILDVLAVLTVLGVLLYQRRKARRAAREKQKLISATERDALTGLYNTSFFYEYANRLYRERSEEQPEAIMLNVDSFHTVNALYGREFGDTVLRLLGETIRDELAGGPGIAGRIEADCFVLYCPHREDYEAVLTRFQESLNRVGPGVCLRMGVMPWAAEVEPVQMFERARAACGLARKVFEPHMVVFDEKMHRQELFEQRLLNDLDRAVREKQFLVWYQPKYDIQCDPPKLVSAEALIRWKHPELGMVFPGDFIPLLEQNGRVGAVDKYVWRETARQIAAWRDAYGTVVPVSVNLSRMDILDPKLEQTIEELVAANGLERSALKLEVTESAYIEDAERIIAVVDALRKKGYQIEMDDFGVGYSSLNMLSALPVDILKMDREFVRNIGRDEKDDRLVALILDIARNLEVPVVAEGVETPMQLSVLKQMGCAFVQGFYFSRPVQPSEFEKLAFRQA